MTRQMANLKGLLGEATTEREDLRGQLAAAVAAAAATEERAKDLEATLEKTAAARESNSKLLGEARWEASGLSEAKRTLEADLGALRSSDGQKGDRLAHLSRALEQTAGDKAALEAAHSKLKARARQLEAANAELTDDLAAARGEMGRVEVWRPLGTPPLLPPSNGLCVSRFPSGLDSDTYDDDHHHHHCCCCCCCRSHLFITSFFFHYFLLSCMVSTSLPLFVFISFLKSAHRG